MPSSGSVSASHAASKGTARRRWASIAPARSDGGPDDSASTARAAVGFPVTGPPVRGAPVVGRPTGSTSPGAAAVPVATAGARRASDGDRGTARGTLLVSAPWLEARRSAGEPEGAATTRRRPQCAPARAGPRVETLPPRRPVTARGSSPG
ncbi:hypothetical protein GCM10009528_29870 [Kineococcus aurantiacus]